MYWEGQIGIGDGVTTEFDTPFHTIDPTRLENYVKVNGLNKEVELSPFRSDISLGSLIHDYKGKNPYNYMANPIDSQVETLEFDFELTKAISMKTIEEGNGYGYMDAMISYSLDGENYTDVSVDTGSYGFRFNTIETYDFTPTPVAKFFKVALSAPHDVARCAFGNFRLIPQTLQKQIKFPTPPAPGEIITAKLWTDGIPKDEKHVLDVTIDLKFKDGGVI